MSDDLKILKERIYNDNNVEKILEELGCDEIRFEQQGSLIVAPHPDGWNKRAVQVKLNPNLNAYVRNEGIEGDIFSIVGFFLYQCKNFEDVKAKLYQIKQWIINVLEYDDFVFFDFEKPKPKTDWNWWLRPIQKARTREIEIHENKVLDNLILNEYIPYPWHCWVNDGVSIETQLEYGVGFHVESERVTIPIHNRHGQLIGVKGRYYGKDESILNEKKYTYLYPCSKSIELFNFHRAIHYIQDKKECVIVEGAKSTMILHSWGIKNAVAIEGDRLSPVQAKLLKDIGLDVDLIFAFDKDKSQEFVKQQVKQIKNRRVFYLWDENNLFEDEKASPVDKTYDIWMQLYNDRHRYRIS